MTSCKRRWALHVCHIQTCVQHPQVDGNDRMLGVPMEFDVVAPPGVGEQPAPVYLLLRSEHWQLLRAREKAPEDGQPAGVECNDFCDNE